MTVGIVLPLTREWIEIMVAEPVNITASVLPLTREWIEILATTTEQVEGTFSLLRGSGLKFCKSILPRSINGVLPLTREWIEMERRKR